MADAGAVHRDSVSLLSASEIRRVIGPTSDKLSRPAVRRLQEECNALAVAVLAAAYGARAPSSIGAPLQGTDIRKALEEDDRFAWLVDLLPLDAHSSEPLCSVPSLSHHQRKPHRNVELHRAFLRGVSQSGSTIAAPQCRLSISFMAWGARQEHNQRAA